MATELEKAKFARDSAQHHLDRCRADIESAMAAEKVAFKEWYEAEQKYTKLKVTADMERRVGEGGKP